MASLPHRAGTRPTTSTQIPHRQLDQQPADRRHLDALLALAAEWPGVIEAESGVSVEGARALTLPADAPVGPPEAFMVGHEFAHGHANGDFSLHACLPPDLADEAVRAGWAEPHYLVKTGRLPNTVVMLYAPRSDTEREVVLGLLHAAYQFARTADRVPQGEPS